MSWKTWLGIEQHKTLNDAVHAGDFKAVERMLEAGADPNSCPVGGDDFPVFYALKHGPKMVKLLVDHGARVNVTSRSGVSPLAAAEARGQQDVAAMLKAAGAALRTEDDEYEMDPRFRLQLQQRIPMLVWRARVEYPHETPEAIAGRVQPLLNYQIPPAMPVDIQRGIAGEIHKLIIKACEKE